MGYRRNNALQERFEEKFIPEPNSGCWIWFASNSGEEDSLAYGCMKYEGKHISAHRISYELYCSEIPDGMQVLHKCDFPPCVNPEHLFLGTASDNMNDMFAKKRHPIKLGIEHYKAKLDWEKVEQIRKLSAKGMGRREIARLFGVTHGAIGFIVKNQAWRV